jgi:phosphatidate cytidylyltransferase
VDIVTSPLNVLWLLGAMIAALVAGSAVRVAWLVTTHSEKTAAFLARLRTWWVLTLLFVAVVLLGRTAAVLLFGVASWLSLREFFNITAKRTGVHAGQWLAYGIVPINYLWVWLGWYDVLWVSVPVGLFLLVSAYTVSAGKTKGFLVDVAVELWGVMLLVFCLSHAALLFALPKATNPVAGVSGWFLFLVLLTEMNDIAQALWGRRFGKHQVTPRVSPHKTWEGLILGATTTVLLAMMLGSLLTPLDGYPVFGKGDTAITLPLFWSAVAGLIIAIGGFFGDITMSAVKRDSEVKDSGTILPGMGGVLDRVDSLTFTAPLFFYFVYFLCGH